MARPVVFTLCLRTPFRSVCLSVWMSGCLNVDDHDAPLSMPLTGRRAPEEPLKNHPPTQTVNHPNGDRFRPLGTLANCSICTDDKDKGHFGFARHLVRIQIYFGMRVGFRITPLSAFFPVPLRGVQMAAVTV